MSKTKIFTLFSVNNSLKTKVKSQSNKMNIWYSIEVSFSSYSVTFGGGSSQNAQITQMLFNYSSFSSENHAIGFFGTSV